MSAAGPIPAWARWGEQSTATEPWTVGVEEEVMLVEPSGWSLAQSIDDVLPAVSAALGQQASAETHGAALELATQPHARVGEAMDELASLRGRLLRGLAGLGLRAACAGTHPFAVWRDTRISGGERQQLVYGSMRELARREPTFALHVHVGVPDATDAVRLANRMRAHLPLLLALSANSPFWQGRDTGLSSARTPLFQAFPRVGIPRAFDSYREWVETVDLLIRCEAFPESTFLWWDVRLQPRFGTVEVRIMDSQTTVADTAAIVALIQSTARLEVEEGYVSTQLVQAPEVLAENRFLAARDGMEAELIDPGTERTVPARDILAALLEACRDHARDLGCAGELAALAAPDHLYGDARQRELARGADRLPGLVCMLGEQFRAPPTAPAGNGTGGVTSAVSEQ